MKKENQLLTRLLKTVGLAQDEVAQAAAPEVVEAVVEVAETAAEASDLQAQLSAVEDRLESVTGELNGKLAEAVAALAEMTAKFETAQAMLDAIEAEKAKLIADAVAVKLAARKEKVVAAIGTEKAAGLMLATEGLDDAAFEAVVSALAGSVEVEAKTDLFQEVGVTAEADAAKVVEKSAEMKLLEEKYSGTK